MARLGAFTQISIDGFYSDPEGGIDWIKSVDKSEDYEAYSHAQARGGSTLVFGRKTYEMMKSYWPTAAARESDPQMAEVVDNSPKVVFSRTLKSAPDEPHWKHVTIVNTLDETTVRKLKKETTGTLTILGSGTVVQQITDLGLIDEYALIVFPVVLGAGKSLFKDVPRTDLHLVEARRFDNGLNILKYEPAGRTETTTTNRQKTAARRNIRKAAAAAKRKRTIAHLPKATRTALGKKGSSVRKRK
jgi:dihydrofolate reductase